VEIQSSLSAIDFRMVAVAHVNAATGCHFGNTSSLNDLLIHQQVAGSGPVVLLDPIATGEDNIADND
jgi:hypothetical protein